ncbi:MAG: SDR family oxidoreductase [Flavobacteriales bacterium]|nr:SDR family oxidoreductase [Flavobacteriales bacterium]MCX7650467.1 SDR family oxidoreductase [Flavobacteriales bacterium]MDW8432521.1 SDR family oxidoreductase [Flavobacteriales bacterium]
MTAALQNKKILITGGAGFIGSHLVEKCLQEKAGLVRVMDNFSTGFRANLEGLSAFPAFELLEGDIRDFETCRRACAGVDIVFHQAALGSVPRSIQDPLTTHAVNADGFLNMMHAAREAGVRHFIYASSSSVYGDNEDLPKREEKTGNPLSPYALTKALNEKYAEVFHRCYGFRSVGLRYFNVFGPRQDPQGPYAAVIPRFIFRCLAGDPLEIYGDGSIERDFTYVDNVIHANLLSLQDEKLPGCTVFNVGCGTSASILSLAQKVKALYEEATGQPSRSDIEFCPPRPGDILRSEASIENIRSRLGYEPLVSMDEGLRRTLRWFIGKKTPATV